MTRYKNNIKSIKNQNIIIISVDAWSKEWNRPHQVAKWLIKNNKVLYIERPLYFFSCLMHPLDQIKNKISRKRWIKLFRSKLEKKNQSLYIYTPLVLVPYQAFYLPLLSPLRLIIKKLNEIFRLLSIKLLIKKLDMKNSILFNYMPNSGYVIGKISEQLSIYDCIDPWKLFFTNNLTRMKDVEREDIETSKSVNIVFTTTNYLYEEKKSYNSNAYLIPNGTDISRFEKNKVKNSSTYKDTIKSDEDLKVGFVGTIDWRIDTELIEYLSKQYTNFSFIFIGPVENQGFMKRFRNTKNILIHKAINYLYIPNFISALNVLIIPYLNSDFNKGTSPLKFYEYLASGKPIVATKFSEIKEIVPLYWIATNKDEFAEKLTVALKFDNLEIAEKRKKLAKSNSWENRFRLMEEYIISHLKQ